ncbi:MAG: VWA domain-containing protein [Phycisphaeraceae bacterium]|nr:VWA domain-containing protein [Phycisphaerales bacterium]MCB9859293.1 VWA domain-containing protein [Phycisphaeraceae bacterium]
MKHPHLARHSRHITRLLASAAVFGAALPAHAMQPEITEDTFISVNVIVPQRHVITPRDNRFGSVELKQVQAKVQIANQIATTTLRMAVYNPGGRMAEAQLLLPVPEGATVKHFELEGLGEEGIAKILPRDEARRMYEAIVAKAIDPGLLEFVGYNLIKSSVFPVQPGQQQFATVVYEQVLAAESGRIDYMLPRTEALEATGVAWTFDIDIISNDPVSTVYSPTHDLDIKKISSSHVRANVPSRSANQNNGAFRLSYLIARNNSDQITASLMAYPDPQINGGKGGYFLMIAGLPDEADRPKVKREVTLVIDRSGSMRGEKIEQAREAALQVIEALDEGEAFNIIDYSTSVEMFASKPVIKSSETIAQAREYLASLTPNGGTNIHDALIEALRQPATDAMLPMVLFLTDGLPTIGVRNEKEIVDAAKAGNPHNRRIFTFGVGVDVNAPLLRTIADGARATSTFVLPNEDVEVKIGQVFTRLSGPVLASPTLVALGADGTRNTRHVRDMIPGTIPDLFEGDQLIVLGQYTDDKDLKLQLSGEFYGVQRAFQMSFDLTKASTEHAYVPRLWASRKIATLISEIRAMGAGGYGSTPATADPRFNELVDEIVRLSTRWGVLTEYTAFLAADDEMSLALGSEVWRGPHTRAFNGAPPAEGASPPSSAPAREIARSELDAKAVAKRDGSEAISQEMNIGYMERQAVLNTNNDMITRDMRRVSTANVRQIADRSLYMRNARWIDADLLDKEAEDPEQIIDLGSDEFFTFAVDLAKQNRQGLLALNNDLYLIYQGKRTLVRFQE